MTEQYSYKFRDSSVKIGHDNHGNINTGDTYNYNSQNRDLAEAAAEIQQLLEKLSRTYPSSTNKDKMAIVAEAVDFIESKPTLRERFIKAITSGSKEALKEAINHPLANILIATFEGWQTNS